MSDNESDTMTIEFEPQCKSSKSVGRRSASQDDQLTKARNIALTRRRIKQKQKLTARIAELRAQIGDADTEQLEKAVKHLIKLEDHHRSKLLAATEKQNENIKKVNNNINRLTNKVEQIRNPRVKTLSELSSVVESRRD